MTIDHARLIIQNKLAYPPREVREVALWLRDCPIATAEDKQAASAVIAIGTRDR